jgi:hypothetical protein
VDLELICGYEDNGQQGTFWENGMEDYNAGLLTVNYRLDNTGPEKLVNVRVSEATATNEVKIATELPLLLGEIDPGGYITFHLKWLLPNQEVTGFQTDIEVCADCPREDPLNGEPKRNIQPEIIIPAQPALTAATLPATGFDFANALMLTLAMGGSGLLVYRYCVK